MSDVHNHILCGMDSLQLIKDEDLKSIIMQNRSLYRFGCMGGDIFFYYDAMKLNTDPWIKGIGIYLHTDPDRFFDEAKNQICSMPQIEAEKLTAYLMGFISHHALDAQTHPFINYFGGIAIRGREDTDRYEYTHKRLEILLDIRYAQFRKLSLVDVTDITEIPQNDLALIEYFYKELLKNLKKEIIPDDMIKKCLKDFKSLMVVSKQYQFLRPILAVEDKITNKKYKFTRPFFSMSAEEKKLDILNLRHLMWLNPCDKNESMDFSYPELFEYAVRAAAKRMKKYFDFINDKGNDRLACAIFKNIGYITGSGNFEEKDIKNINCIL